MKLKKIFLIAIALLICVSILRIANYNTNYDLRGRLLAT